MSGIDVTYWPWYPTWPQAPAVAPLVFPSLQPSYTIQYAPDAAALQQRIEELEKQVARLKRSHRPKRRRI